MGFFLLVMAAAVVINAAVVGGVWWWRRNKGLEANDPNCPVCRSQQLEGVLGEMGTGTATLGEAYRCRECGFDREQLGESTREIIEALEDLQKVEFELAQVNDAGAEMFLRSDSSSMHRDAGDQVERRLFEAWEAMERVRDQHPEAFQVSVSGDSNRTAAALLDERLEDDNTAMAMDGVFDVGSGQRMRKQRQSLNETLETIREALQAEAQRRRS